MVFKNFLSKAKDIDLLANLADGVILVGSTGEVQYANEAAGVLFETQKSELLKSNINELIEGGLDLGVVFLGKEYLTTYARQKAPDAWNTTTTCGGRYVPFTPEQEIIELADKARKVFDLPFTCVDVALTKEGPFVFEVSAFGGFNFLFDFGNFSIEHGKSCVLAKLISCAHKN